MTELVDIQRLSVGVWNDSVEMEVEVLGSGPPVVYFHALAGHRWDGFLTRLAESAKVYAIQLPGTGQEDPHSIHKVDSFLDLILMYEETIRALGLARPVALAQSFGGMLAAELASFFPALFSKLVMLDPIGLWRDDTPVRVADLLVAPHTELPSFLFFDPTGPAAQRFLAMPDDQDAVIRATARMVWSIGCGSKFIWPVPDNGLAGRLHRIEVPTLVVWGAQDTLVPVTYAGEFASRIAGSRVEVIERCGHIPQVEQEDETMRLVREFLAPEL